MYSGDRLFSRRCAVIQAIKPTRQKYMDLEKVYRLIATSSRQLRYEQAKHVDGLQSDGWILLKCFRSRVMAGSP